MLKVIDKDKINQKIGILDYYTYIKNNDNY